MSLSEEFIKTNKNDLDFILILKNYHLSEETLIECFDCFNNECCIYISKHYKLSNEFIEAFYSEHLYEDLLFKYQKLSDRTLGIIIDNMIDNDRFDELDELGLIVSQYQSLSMDFIINYEEYLYIDIIKKYQYVTEDFELYDNTWSCYTVRLLDKKINEDIIKIIFSYV